MGYVQMTLDDWVQMKQKLKQELQGVKQSFVRIGYMLRKIDDQKAYESDGYKSIAEFAKAEYGLEPSTTSRFMSINREYSVDGYSETLRPEFADMGRSQLEEMLKLPESDRQMIQPETSREDIRELKRFNKTEPAAGVADDVHQLVENFFKDNPEILNRVFSERDMGSQEENVKKLAEIINPGGNRSYKKGLFFLMMYENKVVIKKFGGSPQNLDWEEFIQIAVDIFGEAAAGDRTWENYFGKNAQEETDAGRKGEKTREEKIAPAQKSPENLEAAASAPEEKQAENAKVSGEKGPEEPEKEHPGEENAAEGRKTEEKELEKEAAEPRKRPEIQEAAGGEAETIEEKETAQEDSEAAGGGEKEAQLLEDPGTPAEEEGAEPEPAEAEDIEKPFGSRIEYLDALTVSSAALYMAKTMKDIPEENRKVDSVKFWWKWLSQEVDREGRAIK